MRKKVIKIIKTWMYDDEVNNNDVDDDPPEGILTPPEGIPTLK
jgi:hypothetical protein